MRFSKTAVYASVFLLGLALTPNTASAGLIEISDLTDGAPTFTTSADIDVIGLSTVPEGLKLEGIFHIPFGNGDVCPSFGGPSCDQSFNLIEADGSLSDTIHLFVDGPGGPVGPDWQERFTLTFLSDPLAGPLPGQSLAETGLFQALPIDTGPFLCCGTTFNILVRSDVDAVPEPASLALLGTGLVAVAYRTRRKRANQA